MALSVASIKGRLQAAYGPAQDTVIQGIELDKLANALFNIFTGYPVLTQVLARPTDISVGATGTLIVPTGTFLPAFQAAFPPAQDTGIQTAELTKLAEGIETSINADGQSRYPLVPGRIVSPFTVFTTVTPAQALIELQNAFGSAQDDSMRDSVLIPLSVGISVGLQACFGTVSVFVGKVGNVLRTGVIA